MKLPWDKSYLQISFHVIFTVIVVYILSIIVDLAAFIISNMRYVSDNIFSFIGSLISLFSPLVVALIIAYLLDPVADFYQKKYENLKENIIIPFLKKYNWYIVSEQKSKKKEKFKKRLSGTILTYVSVLTGFIVIVSMLMSSLGIGSGSFAETINQAISSTAMTFSNLEARLDSLGYLELFSSYMDSLLNWIEISLFNLGNRLILFVASAGTGILNFIISLVVAFYFMNNKARLKYQVRSLVDTFLPKKPNTIITHILEDLHVVFSEYIRGLILDGIILGTLVGIGLSLVGVDLAILIGVLTAIFNLIPFFGGIMVFFLSVTFELLMGSPLNALYAAIVIIVIQQIDNIFIVPRVVGQKVHLSPPTVMLSLSIAGSLFGIIGMLLVVPICAIIKIFALRFIERYKQRKLDEPKPT